MKDHDESSAKSADRLCSEIQLFDLCDLDSCSHKRSRFCTNEELLAKFESIKEEDEHKTLVYDESEEEEDGSDFDEIDDDYDEEE